MVIEEIARCSTRLPYVLRNCRQCGAPNVISACHRCGRRFVVTQAHLFGEPRAFEARNVTVVPDAVPLLCDYCSAGDRGMSQSAVVGAGLRQATCAACRTEMLSSLGSD